MKRTPGTKKYIPFQGEIYELTVGNDGLWYDGFGGVWALNDQLHLVGDPVVRCGVGLLSLPPDHPLTAQCAIHDYQDSSPEYMAFNTAEDAAKHLRKLVKQTKYKFWAQTFYRLIQARNWLIGKK